MVFEGKRLASLVEADLRALLAQGVLESATLDYKLELPGGSERERRDFLDDVDAFALAGGHIFFGVEELGGVPTAIPGLARIDADKEMLRLRQMTDASIAPRIPGLDFHPILLSTGNVVIAMRVPRSLIGPRMITFGGLQRFMVRHGASNARMDIDEIRAAFASTSSFADRLRAFRAERLGRVLAADLPSPLQDTPVLVMHLLPVSTPEWSLPVDLNVVFDNRWSLWPPRAQGGGFDRRFNFDGVLLAVPELSYLQIFRNGAMEAAVVLSAAKSPPVVYGDQYETMLIDELPSYLRGLALLGVDTPVFLALSLVGVKDWKIGSGAGGWAWPGERPVDRDVLPLPELMLESLDLSTADLARDLHPIFAIAWNASGRPDSTNYRDGEWAPGGRR